MMPSSKKHKGSDSILYDAIKGALVTSGQLSVNSWYKINDKASSGSALGDLATGSIFKTPMYSTDAITLVAGDEVYPLTLTEVCKADVEISGEMGVIDTTDSCDFPYTSNLPDGFTNLSGSINTMMRFDEETDELVDVTKDYLNKFFTLVEDDGEGTYTVSEKDDSDIILMILLNKNALNVYDQVENWIITPAILSGVSSPIALKDSEKADFSWTKGQGPASLYVRTVPSET
jgi:hypothetical protein